MIEPAFNQMQVQPAIGVDFATGVRTLMRQDPDIIMVGEIRDRDTADMAVQAALTGHLVLSTLHTNDAPTAVTRLLDLGVPPYLLSSTLLGVMAQRLVRTLCPHCKKPVGPAGRRELARGHGAVARRQADPGDGPGRLPRMPDDRLLRPHGPLRDHADDAGDPAADRRKDADDHAIREQAYKDGMKPLRVSGAMKVAAGLTTLDEVMKVAPLL